MTARLRLGSSLGLAIATLGCRACADDRAAPPVPVAGGAYQVATLSSARCSGGIAAPEGYAKIVEIPSQGGGQVFVQDVNDDDVAVGAAQDAAGNYHAFRYTDVGGVQDLGALPVFGTQSYASAIAPDGSIAGHSDRGDGTGTMFGYRYTATGGRVEVCPSGCSVWDVNGSGQVVGLLPGQVTSTWQAFVWTARDGLSVLGTLGGARSSASGVSEQGVVVGNAQLAGSATADVGHAFIYDTRARSPRLRDLNTVAVAPDWVLQAANDVNATYVVGYGTHAGRTRAFRLDVRTGAVVDLGTTPGGGASYGWAVDADGDVVGWAQSGQQNAALVSAPALGGTRRLGDFVDPALGWNLQQANGVNDRGTIVGWGYRQGEAVGFKLSFPRCARR